MKLIISKYTIIILCKYTNIIIYKYTIIIIYKHTIIILSQYAIIILSQYAKHASQTHICDHRERTARTFLYDKNTSCNILPTLLPDVVRSPVYWKLRQEHIPCLMTIFVYLISRKNSYD